MGYVWGMWGEGVVVSSFYEKEGGYARILDAASFGGNVESSMFNPFLKIGE